MDDSHHRRRTRRVTGTVSSVFSGTHEKTGAPRIYSVELRSMAVVGTDVRLRYGARKVMGDRPQLGRFFHSRSTFS